LSAKSDLTQVGASEQTSTTLNELLDLGHINELSDGYRLGIVVALAFGRTPSTDSRQGRKTTLAVSSLDPDGAMKAAIREIYPDVASVPYRAAEDLAEQGVEILKDSMEGDSISFSDLMKRVWAANPVDKAGTGVE
jgi:hypothetical protein